MLKESDLGYTAGIVDGESTIACYYNKGSKNMQQYVKVRMKYDKVPKWLLKKWGGSLAHDKIGTWSWKLSSIPATQMLKYIMPYMVEKKTQARIFIRLRHLKASHKGPDTPDLKIKKRKLYKLLIDLHN